MDRATLRRCLLISTLSMSLLVASATPVFADSVAEEERFVELINAERRAVGSGPLIVLPELVDKARHHANRMADRETIFHSDDLGEGIDGWKVLGENVGRGGNIETLHQAFMNSDGHRENLLNPIYDGVGVGVVWSQGIPYVVEVFMDSVEDLRVQFTPPFADDDSSVHEADIIAIHDLGITRGCDTARYCPDRNVTRAEMATMLVRAFELTGNSGDAFGDDDSSIHESAIEALAATGVTRGCAPGRFCPEQDVTRAEMATFLSRILELPPAPSAGFSDTGSTVHAAAIDSLAAAGVTKGCTATSFCPDDEVTRAQMASFLIRALDR